MPVAPVTQAPTTTGSASKPFVNTGIVDLPIATLLSMVTFGVYWMVWVYQAMKEYRTRSGREGANMEQYFWILVGCYAGTFVLTFLTFILGILAAIASVVMSVLFVNEFMRDRDAIANQTGVTGLPSAGFFVTLIIVSNVAAFTIIGLIVTIPLAIWFYYQFYAGHNLVMRALQEQGRA